MTAPSSLQMAGLVVCGALMAGFGCFHTADARSGIGVLVFAVGLAALGFAAILLARRRIVDSVSPAPAPGHAGPQAPPAQPRPSVPQSLVLALCAFLLFFFSCGGLLLSDQRGMSGVAWLMPLSAVGLIGGGLFGITAIVLFVLALARRPSVPPADPPR